MEEIDIKELFGLFWKKKIQILIIVLIFILFGVMYSYAYVQPEYESYTTVLLVGNESSSDKNVTNQSSGITQSDITLNSKLVSTYSEIIKSKAVLSEVIKNLELKNETEESLKAKVNVTSVKDTEFLRVSAKNKDSKKAAAIANEIAKVFSEKIVEIYNISNVTILDKAEISNNPYNQNHLKDIVIFMAIGIVASGVYILIINMIDTTIKTEKEIEDVTGVSVLSLIPEYNFDIKRGEKRK